MIDAEEWKEPDPARRTAWVRQVYGYAVCLISVVVLLFSSGSMLDAVINYSNPERSRMMYGPGGSSFESYLAMQRDRTMPAPAPAAADTTSIETHRQRWEAMREENAQQARFDAFRLLAKHGLLVLLSLALFITHWRWLRRIEGRA